LPGKKVRPLTEVNQELFATNSGIIYASHRDDALAVTILKKIYSPTDFKLDPHAA